jgi:hypothetical protein
VTAAKKPLITVTKGPRNAYTDPDTGLRFYTWDGNEYPSVTSVRNLAGMPHALANWRTNQVIEKAMTEYPALGRMLGDGTDPKAIASWLRKGGDQKRDVAAALGTAVHDAAASGMTLDKAPEDVAPFLLQYRKWLDDSKCEVLLSEKQVFNESIGYAGTFDLLGRMRGQYWMIDLKTGKGTYPEHALQLEAYARAEFIGENDVVDQAATDLLEQVSGRAVLHLRPDGWSFKIIPASDKTWVAFRGLLAFANWTYRNPNLDMLVSRTIESKP